MSNITETEKSESLYQAPTQDQDKPVQAAPEEELAEEAPEEELAEEAPEEDLAEEAPEEELAEEAPEEELDVAEEEAPAEEEDVAEDEPDQLTEVPPCAEGLPPTPPPVVEATPQPMLEVAKES